MDLGFSCTVSAQGVLIPINSHGNTSDPYNFASGTFFTWDYTLTLLSAPMQNFILTGDFIPNGYSVGTWTLSGVGNSINLVATGYIEQLNVLTIGSGSNSLNVLVPGPVPEAGTLGLALLGLLGIAALALRRS